MDRFHGIRAGKNGLLWAAGLTLALGAALPAVGEPCPDGSPSIDLQTGQDVDRDGFDDNWSVFIPGNIDAQSATIVPVPVEGWRGNLKFTGPFNSGFRYPVLGDGRWIGDPQVSDTYVYEVVFSLDDSCSMPTLAGEWAADNTVEISLNGEPIGIESNPNAMPPLPWLSNTLGSNHPNAGDDGLIHPSCGAEPFRCELAEDEFREIHYFEVSDPSLFNFDGYGTNVLTFRVTNLGGPSGFLLTGGTGTSVTSGANVRCCAPDRPGNVPVELIRFTVE